MRRECLPTGQTGEIVVAGDHVLPGYLGGIGDEETKFRVSGVAEAVGGLDRIGGGDTVSVDEEGAQSSGDSGGQRSVGSACEDFSTYDAQEGLCQVVGELR